MNDLILQLIFLPITAVMFGVEAVGKAVTAVRSSNGTNSTTTTLPPVANTVPATAAPSSTSAPAPPAPSRPVGESQGASPATGVKVVDYHPNAKKG